MAFRMKTPFLVTYKMNKGVLCDAHGKPVGPTNPDVCNPYNHPPGPDNPCARKKPKDPIKNIVNFKDPLFKFKKSTSFTYKKCNCK